MGRVRAQAGVADTPVHRVGAAFLAPPALLALAGLLLGPGIDWTAHLFEQYAKQYPTPAHPYHLALWHGFGPALGLSVLAWAGGAALFLAREPVVRLGRRFAWPKADEVFGRTVLGLERSSLQITGAVQKGSLPSYVATVLGVMFLGLLAVLATDRPWGATPRPECGTTRCRRASAR